MPLLSSAFVSLTQPWHCSVSPVHSYPLCRQIASASTLMAEPVHCRLSTVQNADEVLVMENGTIVERGTHSELLAKGELARCCHHPHCQVLLQVHGMALIVHLASGSAALSARFTLLSC